MSAPISVAGIACVLAFLMFGCKECFCFLETFNKINSNDRYHLLNLILSLNLQNNPVKLGSIIPISQMKMISRKSQYRTELVFES